MTGNRLLVATIIASTLLTGRGVIGDDQDVDKGLELFIAEPAAAPGLKAATVEDGGNETIYLHDAPFLTGKHVASAKVVQDEGRPAIEFTFDDVGKEAMAKATRESLPAPGGPHKRLAFMIGGKVVFAPRIVSQVGAKAQITGSFNHQEAEALVAKMMK